MPFQIPKGLVASVSGFRGRVGDPLTPEVVTRIAAAYGSFLRSRGAGDHLLIGRDSRTSGPMFLRSATAGLMSVGCSVTDLGIVPTPTLMLAVEENDVAGGIGITASHNPAEWNALKFATAEGMFLDQDGMAGFMDRLLGEEPVRAPWDGLGTVRVDDGTIDRHLERILEMSPLDVEALRERRFKVALDCVRGAGGLIMPRLLEALGCEVHTINEEADGLFPRDPEPTAAHLRELGDWVLETGAEIGFAVDPDVDRLSLVDETGTPMGEDLTLALACATVLGRTPGPVVTNLSTSQVVEDVAHAFDVPVYRSPVGEINVARRMPDAEAVVGGEGNGGIILPEIHLTRDAPVGAALILQHLLDREAEVPEGTISGAGDRWPGYEIVKEKVSFPREALDGGYRALLEDLGDDRAGDGVDRSDGLRLRWESRREWLHVRPSGTEPVVRVIAEAQSRDRAQALVDRAKSLLEGVA